MNRIFLEKLQKIAGADSVAAAEEMKNHTTFRAGGTADYYVVPRTEEEIRNVLRLCREADMEYYIIGNGSNLLVSDAGYRGVIVQISKYRNRVTVEGTKVKAEAGVLLSALAKFVSEQELTGFEFAAGIPGSLGGAVVMNAGAYGGEMKDVITGVKVMTDEGEIRTLTSGELNLGYRKSCIPENGYIVLEAELSLSYGEREQILARMEELKRKRLEKQPLEYPSAGSTFKRPKGYFAGKLISDAGLKGFSVGGAAVSEKHAGFVINLNGATASDIAVLIRTVQEKVKEQSGVSLETEVKFLGDFTDNL